MHEPPRLDDASRRMLPELAWESLRYGVDEGRALTVKLEDFPEACGEPGASFVTLEEAGALRGCIGSLSPRHPLAVDVAENAFRAGLRDPRFNPVTEPELKRLSLYVSVLSPSVPLSFSNEKDLIRQLRPGVDGLVLEDQGRAGTFLPSVWDQCPDPADFLSHLKRKAGLPPDHWSKSLRIERYTVERLDG